MTLKIGLIREGKTPPDKRVAFTPLQAVEIQQRFKGVKIICQQSEVRAFPDDEYRGAGVKVVATYKLYNVNRNRLENLLHRFFAAARLDVEIPDRFGRSVRPREWFLVPLSVIDEVVKRIEDRTITDYAYDRKKALLVKVGSRRS